MGREPLREWMKSVVAHAVCRLGMQLRGVMSSNGIACGAPPGGRVSGHTWASAHWPPSAP